MEIGAVKQTFNNEIILLKRKLNQAKIQVIHKLTRKSKELLDKKGPEHLKEKYKRKAKSAIDEVLIIKKLKPKDIAKFSITHSGELNSYINRPQVDHEKACARLLLNKCLQDKYTFLRSTYSNVPIKDLFMSRQERRKLKKEAKDNKKNKTKLSIKNENDTSTESDWKVEDVVTSESQVIDNSESSSDEKEPLEVDTVESDLDDLNDENISEEILDKETESNHDSDYDVNDTGRFVKLNPGESNKLKVIKAEKSLGNKTEKKVKNVNKGKNLHKKIANRNFNKAKEFSVTESKIVDPFFIMETGENYISVAEPRPPDEFKDEHKQGNRKLRRAAMFGHVPKFRQKQNNFESNNYSSNDKFNKKSSFQKTQKNFKDRHNNNFENNDRFKQKGQFFKSDSVESKPEKLHPSWEAKKKQSGILPFQGKKVVFDED